MMDIVERLRGNAEDRDIDAWMTCNEAAAEIELLREALRDIIPYVDTCNAEHREAQDKARSALQTKGG